MLRASFLAVGLVAAIGCADPVPTAVQPCPCADGFFCCSSGVCAKDQTACAAATAALSAQVRGEWRGYTEGKKFESGSDRIVLTLSAQPDGTLSGTVVLGEGTPPPPATDGTVVWPDPNAPKILPSADLFEGYPYEAHHVSWEARRLQFDISLSQPWQPWCELQTSYPLGGDSWGCTPIGPDGVGGYATLADGRCKVDGLAEPIDCGVAQTCSYGVPCHCAADGCDASQTPSFVFDVALRGDMGDGSMNGMTIRLTRE